MRLPLGSVGMIAWAGLGLSTLVEPVGAQSARVLELQNVEAVSSEGFTWVEGVRELRDGRVIVLDVADRMIYLLDPNLERVGTIGTRGQGPGEYLLPAQLVLLSGDSTAILDIYRGRSLVVLPDAAPGGFIPPIAGQLMLLDVRADARGYFYTEGEPIGISSAGVAVLADSVAVERRDRSYASVDTVAFVPVEHLPGTILRNTPGGVTVGRQPALPPPFFTQPQWVVTPNGTVVVVDPDPYHVEATTPDGTRTIGSPIPYSRLETTDAHLESWCSRQGPAFRISRSAGGAQPDAVDVLISAGRCPQMADPPET
jgi:hypothetical protein